MPKLFETTSLRAGDPMIFLLTPGERDQICLNCPLAQCVGLKSKECPIVIEQRRRWREINQRRMGSRPRRKYTRRKEVVNA